MIDVKEKLKELGIDSTNYYPKKTFLWHGKVVIGIYDRELKSDFYFFLERDQTLYRVKYPQDINSLEKDDTTDKFIIPLDTCEVLWKDTPYEDLPDAPANTMTLRDYACIHMKVPKTQYPWLNELIKEARDTAQLIKAE